MYGLKDLKKIIKTDDYSVECPVKDCFENVNRQRKTLKREPNFLCPTHKIYISPSTFEYESEEDNLLWFDKEDKLLFEEIKKVKRESRITRDNSEDALTWNVMRFLDKQGKISSFLSQLSDKEIKEAELILWSYSPKEVSSWSYLNHARIEFGETISRGSEPDIIMLTDKVLYFIEAKLTANNRTTPSDPNNKKKYEIGGDNLFSTLFKSDYDTIAIKEKKYELMRFWLLGSWIAKQLNVTFEFYNLVLDSKEQNIKSEFSNLIIESEIRKFSRLTWEEIHGFIKKLEENKAKKILMNYFENKTIGFDSKGMIEKAFNI